MNKKNASLFILILCALAIFLVTSCVEGVTVYPKPDPNRTELDNTSEYYDQHYKVYTFEGCEYIVINSGSSRWGSHKGNCKNPIHKNTQDGSN
jgi:flagellar basal body-associated protein FliL